MKISVLMLLTLGFLAVTTNLSAQGTAFTYQGQLQNNGLPATGTYDFTFALFTTNNATPAQLGGPLTQTNVSVTNGLFTVALDFGPVFTGTSNWLQIAVRTNGSDAFATLSPLQPLTPVPYALFAAGANASGLTGTLPPAQLPATVVTNGATGLNLHGVFAGNGVGLTNVTAVALATNGQYASFGWLPMLTNSYVSNGIYAFTIPAHATRMTVKLWGAGGDAAYYSVGYLATDGGAGAFSQVTLNVNPGDSYVLVVGQSGSAGGAAGSSDAAGGAGSASGSISAGTGGQASSLFFQAGPNYVMKAVAGGGGGGGIFYGGNAGQADGSGSGYSLIATTLGETNLNLMGGLGAAGADGTGGSGGGYGGGSPLPDGQSGGGGSYGDVTFSGSLNVPGNISDPNYLPGSAAGRADGLGVVILAAPAPVASLSETVAAPAFIGDGSGLTNLSLTALPKNIITNTATGVTLGGTFAGDGGNLTNLNLANVAGKLADYHISSNVPLLINSAVPATGTLAVGGNFYDITAVTLVNPGAGYPTAPTVTVSGVYGFGSGAVVTAAVSNGVVTALTLVNGGSSYVFGATLAIAPPPPVNDNNFFAGTNTFAGPVLATNPASIFAGNGSGLTSVPAASLTGTLPASTLNGVNGSGLTSLPAASLTGTLPAAIFASAIVTNFASVGPLGAANFNFSSHGGRLIITTTGSGSTLSAPVAIGMTVKLDSTIITTNRVWMNVNNHGAFVPQTLVLRNIAAGPHTLTLTAWNSTSTDLNDNFSVFVEELPY